MNQTELQLLKDTLEEAYRAGTGSGHWLPEQHANDLRKCISLVNRELKPKTNVTFSLYCGARDSYCQIYNERSDVECCVVEWGSVELRKKHPSINAAKTWIPANRKDPEWEMAVHEFHGDELVAKYTI